MTVCVLHPTPVNGHRRLPRVALCPIEGLAAALRPVQLSAGAVLIRQGDPGDAYYAIAAGELDAVQDGRFLARYGAARE